MWTWSGILATAKTSMLRKLWSHIYKLFISYKRFMENYLETQYLPRKAAYWEKEWDLIIHEGLMRQTAAVKWLKKNISKGISVVRKKNLCTNSQGCIWAPLWSSFILQ